VLSSSTDPRWVAIALARMDLVLRDHAHCERKAAAQAMALVAAHPSHEGLARRLSALAIEELRHFRAVHAQLRARGLELGHDPGDPYAREMHLLVGSGREQRLRDRLLVCGLIEARSHERLQLLAEALREPALQALYRSLARAEAGHAALFRDLASSVAPTDDVEARLRELAEAESALIAALPLEPRIH
jgi:tRNA-(ms[2]io[6]A)-hydroxylase